MSNVVPFALAIPMMVAISSVSAATADELNVFQRGHAQAVVDIWGPNDTNVTQMGGGRVRLNVQGRNNETHAFSGICPRGAPGRTVDIRGEDTLNILVVPCR